MINCIMKSFSTLAAASFLLSASCAASNCDAPQIWDIFCPGSKSCGNTCTLPCISNWFLRGDILLWRAFEHGLECNCVAASITDTLNSDGTLSTTISGESSELDFEWSPGFRVGGGFNFNNGVSAELYYTHLTTRGFANRSSRTNHAHLKIHFDMLDFIIGHDFWYNKSFSYAPFAGIRGGWIDQKLHARLAGELISSETTLNIGVFHDRQEFWGVGPEMGLQIDVPLPLGFSLFACGDVALLYGRFTTRFNDSTSVNGTTTTSNGDDHFTTTVPAFDLSAGVRFQQDFMCQTFLALQIAWEHHRYIDYNRIGSGDLCLDGVTFTATWQF